MASRAWRTDYLSLSRASLRSLACHVQLRRARKGVSRGDAHGGRRRAGGRLRARPDREIARVPRGRQARGGPGQRIEPSRRATARRRGWRTCATSTRACGGSGRDTERRTRTWSRSAGRSRASRTASRCGSASSCPTSARRSSICAASWRRRVGSATTSRVSERPPHAFRHLYVHIPFCKHKCGYCDFNAYAGMDRLMPDYVDALERERVFARERFTLQHPPTVHLRRGTASRLGPALVARLLAFIRRELNVAPDAEVTLEANPASTDEARLEAWME